MAISFEIKQSQKDYFGPGIRSAFMMRGCPLHCPWCTNSNGHTHLGSPLQISPARASEMLLLHAERLDTDGITMTGGEAASQFEFANQVLKTCHEKGIDTAVETCLYLPLDILEQFISVTDHFIVDIKFIDSELHQRVLGVGNVRILRNFTRLVSAGVDIHVRTPIIPGYTDSEENIRGIAGFIAGQNPNIPYELLFQSEFLEQNNDPSCSKISDEQIDRYYRILQEAGLKNVVRTHPASPC